ncbi:hypothetical protein [Mycobacterium sp. E3305]|uniref:hypothetical protein n=1 Tax=Mycobacterium sp. E3305 TaxID=1834145 RepID=UPI000800FBC6|nr:hypothetical protein [Mycobacterium sp. E3305]OBG79104.1 hypothetical protein A5701_14475 [Mycobacterium sp. E3305]
MRISPEAARLRSQIAGLKRAVRNGERTADDPQLIQAQDDLRAVMLRQRAETIVAEWQPLTDQQRQDIAAILLAGANYGAA